jgi:single-strand DNA-binding protein
MAGGVNKAILVGNLGNDPELKYTASGAAVCEFSLATSESWLKDGAKQEKTTWHRVKVWGKRAEVVAKYLAKGRQVYIDGRIENRSYDDKDGNKRYITEIVANDVQFLGGGKGRDGGGHDEPALGGNAPPADGDDLPFVTISMHADSPVRRWNRWP